jgi:uncharacterized protein
MMAEHCWQATRRYLAQLPFVLSVTFVAVGLCSEEVDAQPMPEMIAPQVAADSPLSRRPGEVALVIGDWQDADFQRIEQGGPWLKVRGLAADDARFFELLSASQWPQAMAWLKAHNPDPNARHVSGATPLSLACLGGHLPMVQALLQRGAEIDDNGALGYTPLVAAIVRKHPAIWAELLRSGAKANVQAQGGQWPLHAAAASGQLDAMQALVKAGARWGEFNRHGRHALAEAAFMGQIPAMQWLVAHGASYEARDEHRLNAVHAAALGRQAEALGFLLERGVPVPSEVTALLIDGMSRPAVYPLLP